MTGVNWAAVAASDYVVPKGLNPPDALHELLGMLASPDPAVRDAQAYSTLALWTRAGHFDGVLRELGDRAGSGLGNDQVLVRSFSALVLGEVVRRDAQQRVVGPAVRHLWMEHWQFYYPSEQDVRSYDPDLGWIHAVAHGADTAREFALHPITTPAELNVILRTVTERLSSLPMPLYQTEEDRIALALLAVLSRTEVPPEGIRAWLSEYRSLWTPLTFPLSPGVALGIRTLHSLHTLLHLGATLDGAILRPAYPAETLKAIQDTLRDVTPYLGQTA
ncbi:hypothetical protein Dcar01_01991 [Deinococcus carri]|uniref:DUF2785 domain-containing protein n=1 Tax=Deinococcus carri TaxID=1211323 RepID=A0ABP9WAQ5_9DEIO